MRLKERRKLGGPTHSPRLPGIFISRALIKFYTLSFTRIFFIGVFVKEFLIVEN